MTWSERLRDAVGRTDPVDLALRLTLLGFLLRPIGDPWSAPFLLLVPTAALIVPALARSAVLWGVLAAACAWRVAADWPAPDNHAYLLVYWCLAICLGLALRDPAAVLRQNARLLIGLTFALATLWKLALSPDFVDGTFFRVTLISDYRFEAFVQLVGGLHYDQLEAFREFLARPTAPHDILPEFPARFWHLGTALTVATLLSESAVALTFLWPGSAGPARWRDASLMVFCLGVYGVATVASFGWLLLAMGVAQSAPERTRVRTLYAVAFVVVLFYREVPWLEWMLEWARG